MSSVKPGAIFGISGDHDPASLFMDPNLLFLATQTALQHEQTRQSLIARAKTEAQENAHRKDHQIWFWNLISESQQKKEYLQGLVYSSPEQAFVFAWFYLENITAGLEYSYLFENDKGREDVLLLRQWFSNLMQKAGNAVPFDKRGICTDCINAIRKQQLIDIIVPVLNDYNAYWDAREKFALESKVDHRLTSIRNTIWLGLIGFGLLSYFLLGQHLCSTGCDLSGLWTIMVLLLIILIFVIFEFIRPKNIRTLTYNIQNYASRSHPENETFWESVCDWFGEVPTDISVLQQLSMEQNKYIEAVFGIRDNPPTGQSVE
jgi:hypothetical protein